MPESDTPVGDEAEKWLAQGGELYDRERFTPRAGDFVGHIARDLIGPTLTFLRTKDSIDDGSLDGRVAFRVYKLAFAVVPAYTSATFVGIMTWNIGWGIAAGVIGHLAFNHWARCIGKLI